MRIAIVNDALMSVEALRRVLINAPLHEMVWVARNGMEAVESCARDTPDLILMDLVMPVMDGVEATRRIMTSNPCAILIVAATVDGQRGRVFDALGAGAVDVVAAPILGDDGMSGSAAALLAKIDKIALVILATHGSHSAGASSGSEAHGCDPTGSLVVVGASAGGPLVLAAILGSLPPDFPAPLIIVQHIDIQFAHSMADWLNQLSKLTVRIAVSGDRAIAGTALVAGTNDHLVLTESGSLKYTEVPRGGSYRPSIDIFFNSVALNWKGKAAGLLLTGMGKDGARGLKALRETGFLTIAQDRASSAVYGMPKAAAEICAADLILPGDTMAQCLIDVFVHNRRRTLHASLAHIENKNEPRNNPSNL